MSKSKTVLDHEAKLTTTIGPAEHVFVEDGTDLTQIQAIVEPQGLDYCLERGSTMIIEFSGHTLPEGFEIVFYDRFVEVYQGMLYRVFVDGIEVREF